VTKAVVVVEDDLDMRELIRIVLRTESDLRIVGEVATADEAVGIVEREQPDLVILNHFLDADTRGLMLAPALKLAAPHVRILLFSSHDLTIDASREPAVDEFLMKQRLTSLVPTVTRLLGLAA
jgi:DNA-binding NarL/FixJ family response regulator